MGKACGRQGAYSVGSKEVEFEESITVPFRVDVDEKTARDVKGLK